METQDRIAAFRINDKDYKDLLRLAKKKRVTFSSLVRMLLKEATNGPRRVKQA